MAMLNNQRVNLMTSQQFLQGGECRRLHRRPQRHCHRGGRPHGALQARQHPWRGDGGPKGKCGQQTKENDEKCGFCQQICGFCGFTMISP